VPSSFAIQSPIRILDREATVNDLIDEETRWWNIPLIQEVFLKDEASIICNMPICPGRQRDRLAWVGTKNGDYSVKSAYHLANDMGEVEKGSCSDSMPTAHQWKMVWNIAGSRVVKAFLWQASNDILPTRANLHKKGILSDPLCPVCGLESETVVHILWSCPSASDVWLECMKSIHKCSLTEDTFMNLLEMLQRRLDAEGMQLVAVVARLLWLRRNKLIFEGLFQSPADLIRLAQEQLQSFRIAELGGCAQGFQLSPLSNSVPQKWKKPPHGVIKLNWDAAIDKNNQRMGIGIIARDHNRNIVAAFVATRLYITDPSSAEALAAWKMAELCVMLGLNNVLLEGDSLEVVQALCKEDSTWGRYGALISDAKLLLQHVQNWTVCHVKREANEVAHKLAKLAFSFSEERLWREDLPMCVRDVVSSV
jgi:ribonuclease HI